MKSINEYAMFTVFAFGLEKSVYFSFDGLNLLCIQGVGVVI